LSAPTPALAFTGERFAPEVAGAIWYEHWHRYCLVQPLATGRRVLDAACGEGYGSYLLAGAAREVTGVDIAPDAIAHARARYAAPNLRYLEGSCTALPLPDASMDLVVSFETIEHLAAQREMLAEFRRVLDATGVLVISSPNQPVYSDGGTEVNSFHVRELTRDELAVLLAPHFPRQEWYCQRVVAHSAFWSESADERGERAGSMLALAGDAIRAPTEPAPPMYFIVVCAAQGVELPRLPSLSLFDDGAQSLYRDYTRALLRERRLAWEELDARKIAEDRLAELVVAVNDLASERAKAAALAARVATLETSHAQLRSDLASASGDLSAARADLAAALAALGATRSDLAATRGELAAIDAELVRQRALLAEVQARLAYRETVAGWLRWPLARLRYRLRPVA
jgi:2-polyprenyl-3-methyl-5-hydroxy-6-metoxy-1,4-benzoquinol methylase